MARPTAMDDFFVHQIPELLANVVTRIPTGGRAVSSRCTGPMRPAPPTGSAIYEISGARHHRYFPDTDVTGRMPG